MDKILVKMLETSFGRSFITGVFVAMAGAVGFLAVHNVAQMKEMQRLNDRLIEAEQKYRAESDARWRADVERSNALLERIQNVTKSISKRR